MSCVRCSSCSEIIDSDFDLECFTTVTSDKPGDGPILCEPCRDDQMCSSCGERVSMDDTGECLECYAHDYIHGFKTYSPDQAGPGSCRLWDLPGYRDAEKLIRAALFHEVTA